MTDRGSAAAVLPPSERVAEVTSAAYARAAMEGLPMRAVAEVLEGLLEGARSAEDPYAMCRVLDAATATAVGRDVLPVVAGLRDDYLRLVSEQALAAVSRAAATDTARAHRLWASLYAQALCELKLRICAALCSAEGLVTALDTPLTPEWEADRELFCQVTRSLRDGLWGRVFPVTARLLELDLGDDARDAQLLAMASVVRTVWLLDVGEGQRLAELAGARGPDETCVHEAMGWCHWLSGRDVEAEEEATEWLNLDPYDGDAFVLRARALRWTDPAKSEAILRAGTEIVPESDGIYADLIRFYGDPSVFERGSSDLERFAAQLAAVDPDRALESRLCLASTYVTGAPAEDGDRWLARAEEVLDDAEARWPGGVLIALERGRLARRRGRSTEALGILRAAFESPSAWREVKAEIAQEAADMLESVSDWAGAVSWYERALENQDGQTAHLLSRLALTLEAAGRHDEAAERITCAMVGARSLPFVRSIVLDWAVARWPRDPESVRAVFAGGSHQPDDPRGGVDGAAAAEPDVLTYQMLGDVAWRAGDLEEAAAAFGRAYGLLAADPEQDVDRRSNLMRSLALVRNAQALEAADTAPLEAVELHRAAVDLLPDDAILHANLGYALESLAAAAKGKLPMLREAAQELGVAARLMPKGDHALSKARLDVRVARIEKFGERIELPSEEPLVRVEIASDLVPWMDPEQHGAVVFDELIPALRREVRSATGVEVPGVHVRANLALRDGEYRVALGGRTIGVGRVQAETSDVEVLMEHVRELVTRHVDLVFSLEAGVDLAQDLPESLRVTAALVYRACLRDGLALDERLLGVVNAYLVDHEAPSDPDCRTRGAFDPDAVSSAVAHARTVCRSEPAAPVVRVPDWAEQALSRDGALNLVDEHRLVVELADGLERGAVFGLRVGSAVPYVRRLLDDTLATWTARRAQVIEVVS